MHLAGGFLVIGDLFKIRLMELRLPIDRGLHLCVFGARSPVGADEGGHIARGLVKRAC